METFGYSTSLDPILAYEDSLRRIADKKRRRNAADFDAVGLPPVPPGGGWPSRRLEMDPTERHGFTVEQKRPMFTSEGIGRSVIRGVSDAVDAASNLAGGIYGAGQDLGRGIRDYVNQSASIRDQQERARLARYVPKEPYGPLSRQQEDDVYRIGLDQRRAFERLDQARFQGAPQDPAPVPPATVAPAPMQSPEVRSRVSQGLGRPSTPAFLRPQVSTPEQSPAKRSPTPATNNSPPATNNSPPIDGGQRWRDDAAKRASAAADRAEGKNRELDRREKIRAIAELDRRVPEHVRRNARSMGYQGDFSDFNAETYKDLKNKRRGERARQYGERRAQARANVRSKIRPRKRGSDRNTNRTRFGHVPSSTPRHILDMELRREILRSLGR